MGRKSAGGVECRHGMLSALARVASDGYLAACISCGVLCRLSRWPAAPGPGCFDFVWESVPWLGSPSRQDKLGATCGQFIDPTPELPF